MTIPPTISYTWFINEYILIWCVDSYLHHKWKPVTLAYLFAQLYIFIIHLQLRVGDVHVWGMYISQWLTIWFCLSCYFCRNQYQLTKTVLCIDLICIHIESSAIVFVVTYKSTQVIELWFDGWSWCFISTFILYAFMECISRNKILAEWLNLMLF
jgi:hypothetical protein